MDPDTSLRGRDVFTVTRLNREARALLEGGFPALWVGGELSNLSRPASGHLYFTLKDREAQIGCAFFRNRQSWSGLEPRNGMQVLLRGRLSLYEARGQYQLIVEHMEEAGDGALRRAFELLKQRLAAEGLFAEALKRPLPVVPQRVGIVTSVAGAALRDILITLRRQFPIVPVLIYPVPVQGEDSVQRIVNALALAGRRSECDVLILARGGGSLEDLQAFNEEAVARAIRACPIPVVCGVGHETDFTIADLAADARAATPTAAAALVAPDRSLWLAHVREQRRRLRCALDDRLLDCRQRLSGLMQRLHVQDPDLRLRQRMQRLDELDARLRRAVHVGLERHTARLESQLAGLARHHPERRLREDARHLAHLGVRLSSAMDALLNGHRQRFALAVRALDMVSPLATLERGYAIVTRTRDGRILREASRVVVGEMIEARLARGVLSCRVEVVKRGDA